MSRIARHAFAAVPLLFTFLFFTTECPGSREGFVLSLKLGHVSITASRCF